MTDDLKNDQPEFAEPCHAGYWAHAATDNNEITLSHWWADAEYGGTACGRFPRDTGRSAATFYKPTGGFCSDCMKIYGGGKGNETQSKSALEHQEGGTHYKDLPIQPVEYCQQNRLLFMEANAIKYVTRHPSKGQAEDLKKAMHYIQLALETTYGVRCRVVYEE